MADLPLLYSFRRCPYAMRARMAIAISQQPVILREVVLRDKPDAMLKASPKGTVPILVLPDGTVIDESLDVMHWALKQNDPEGWLDADTAATEALIGLADGAFKHALDRYKYPNRYPEEGIDPEQQRQNGADILSGWNDRIAANGGQLVSTRRTLADIALFPFIRQFANTDRSWFDSLNLPALQAWLDGHLRSDLFIGVMAKYPQWTEGDAPTRFPNLAA